MKPLLLLTTILIALYAYLCQKSKESKGLPNFPDDIDWLREFREQWEQAA